jgi:hypothetical protein
MSFKQIGAEGKFTRRSALLKKFQGAFSERPIEPIEVEPSILRRWTRRDLLLFGAGALATLAVGGSQLPRNLLQALGLDQGGASGPENKWLLNKALGSTMMCRQLYIRSIIWYPPILNRRLLRLRTTTTARRQIRHIFRGGV